MQFVHFNHKEFSSSLLTLYQDYRDASIIFPRLCHFYLAFWNQIAVATFLENVELRELFAQTSQIFPSFGNSLKAWYVWFYLCMRLCCIFQNLHVGCTNHARYLKLKFCLDGGRKFLSLILLLFICFLIYFSFSLLFFGMFLQYIR